MLPGSRRPGRDLRFRLRAATAQAHAALEVAMALEIRCRRRDDYRALLARLWGLYAPLELALARLSWDEAETLVRRRAKAPWLMSDLISLGLSTADIETLPLASALPPIESAADALGILYVLEGATLGGQLILARVERDLGVTAQSGARFFASYGPEVGGHWRAFVETLERHAPAGWEIERAAMATFRTFLDWMGDRTVERVPIKESIHAG